MFLLCCDKDTEIIYPTSRLPDVLKAAVEQTTAKAARANGLTCFPKHVGEIINFGQPSDDWPLRTLLIFRDRTPSALTIELLIRVLAVLHNHQPINVLTAGAQAIFTDYTQGEKYCLIAYLCMPLCFIYRINYIA
jgi:hypothetical protein